MRLKQYKKYISFLIIFTIILNGTVLFFPQKSLAVFGNNLVIVTEDTSVTNNGHWFTDIAFKIQQGVHNKLIELKEYVLDGLAWTAANVIIDKFADSLVVWIQNGFNGSPMFLSDPAGFFKDTANNISGAIINDLNMNWLCDSLGKFRFDLTFFLPGTSRSKYACTFEDIANSVSNVAGRDSLGDWINVNVNINQQNIVRRYGDDFRNGGFWMWLATADPKNNQTGRTLIAADSVYSVSEQAKSQEKFGLSVNGGFFGMRKCLERTGPPQDGKEAPCTRYVNTSPGGLVQDQLNHAANKDLARLQVADEIDEVIGALATTLMGWVLTGGNSSGGVLGYDSNASYAGSQRDHYGELSKSQTVTKTKTNISGQIETVKSSEDQYSGSLSDYADAIYGAKDKLQINLAKLECIYATSTNDTTYDYSTCDEKTQEVGKNLAAKGKTSSDVSADIAKVKNGISDIDNKINTFNNTYGANATTTSATALDLLDSFVNEVAQASGQSEITSIEEDYCYEYNKTSKTAKICGLLSDTATEKETYQTHSDKDFKKISKESAKIQTKMETVTLKYACILNDYTGAEDVSSDECNSANPSSSSASST